MKICRFTIALLLCILIPTSCLSGCDRCAARPVLAAAGFRIAAPLLPAFPPQPDIKQKLPSAASAVSPETAPQEAASVPSAPPSRADAPEPVKIRQETEPGEPAKGKVVYLTFDDGPSSLTPQILAVLEKHRINATFFVVGKQDSFSRSMMKKMVADGDSIGIHSWTHEYSYIYKSRENFIEDFTKLRNYIYEVTGVDPKISRFPGGSNNTVCFRYGGHIMRQLVPLVAGMNIRAYDWNVSSGDSASVRPSAQTIVTTVVQQTLRKKTAYVLFHDSGGHASTIQALPIIIEQLANAGYRFEPITGVTPQYEFKAS